jgi:hypothetical protein
VITRRHIRVLVGLLLPLMVLRAMLPAGYMPVADQDGVRIVQCSAGIFPSSGSAIGDHEEPPNYDSCPFAHAAGDAPPISNAPRLYSTEFVSRIAIATVDIAVATSQPRANRARGPPTLS